VLADDRATGVTAGGIVSEISGDVRSNSTANHLGAGVWNFLNADIAYCIVLSGTSFTIL
jgi:hypothetical protein